MLCEVLSEFPKYNLPLPCNQCKKTYQFKAQCKGDISRAFKTAKITDTMLCKRPDVPLQAELLALTVQLRTSQPSILAVLHGWEY